LVRIAFQEILKRAHKCGKRAHIKGRSFRETEYTVFEKRPTIREEIQYYRIAVIRNTLDVAKKNNSCMMH
jgi:hypothetical protein